MHASPDSILPQPRPETDRSPAAGLPLTRRRMLQWTGLNLLGAAAFQAPLARTMAAASPAAPSPAPPLPALQRFPRMVHEYFVDRVRAIERKANAARAALETRVDAERCVETVRAKILACFGPFPAKTPLRARITGVVDRGAYRIEKVIFESRPNFLVTANLYVPQNRSLPAPAVLGVCGHSDIGKAIDAYQSFSQGLARLGYVVLIIDPIGQGERLQYPDANLRSRIGVGVREHLYAGNPQFLVGDFFGSWRAWDGIRALDYLLSRPEVDPNHVGITGNSGGGTMTTWLCGLDSRWTMAAPSCFVTSFRRNLENELPADTEQCPPRALALGLDHEDFIAAHAPKPVILLAQERDYFDVRGTEAAYRRLKRLYRLLGAEDKVALFVGPNPHGFSIENRQAMYGWFNRWTGQPPRVTEPDLTIETPETLRCTPRGQVADLDSRTVPSFTRERSRALAARRPSRSGPDLAGALTRLLKLSKPGSPPDYRILRALPSRKYPRPAATIYAVATDPGIHALVYRLSAARRGGRPPRTRARAILYVAHRSSDAELREESLVRELIEAEPESVFYACDVRGIGESEPNTCGQGSFLDPYGSDYFYAIHALMLDDPYVGQKTRDVLRVLDWLRAVGHPEIHLAAKGWGALPATFAALISDAVGQVTLKNALTSYAEIAEGNDYRWPLAAFVPGVLHELDLPDCYRALASKQLRQIDPWNADPGRPAPSA